MYHGNKEYAVKKVNILMLIFSCLLMVILQTIYRPENISVHSQLFHPNVINLEAVLIGKKHKRYRDKYYAYCFMPKIGMGVNLKNVLSTTEHGCLKYLKTQQVEKWELILLNVKHILRSVLKALSYMHSQGFVHNNVKGIYIHCKFF